MSDLLVNYSEEFLQKKDEAKLRAILHKAFSITKGVSKLNKQELIALILENYAVSQDQLSNNKQISTSVIYKNEEGREFKVQLQKETDEFDECVIITDVDGEQGYETVEDFLQNYTITKYQSFTNTQVVDDNEQVVDDVIADELKDIDDFINRPTEAQLEDFRNRITSEQPIEQDVDQSVIKVLKNEKGATNAYNNIHKETMQRFGYISEDEDGYIEDQSKIHSAVKAEFKQKYGFDSLQQAIDSFKPQPVQLQGSKSQRVIAIVNQLQKSGVKYTSGTVMDKLKELHGETIHRSFCITLMKKALE